MSYYKNIILDSMRQVDPTGWWCVGEIVEAHFDDPDIENNQRDRDIYRSGIHAAFRKLESDGLVLSKKGPSKFISWQNKRIWYFKLQSAEVLNCEEENAEENAEEIT